MSETSASPGPAGRVPGLPAARGGAGTDPRRWLILGTVGLAQLMVVLDATVVNIALALIHGYTTGFWAAAGILGAGAVICGMLFRPGPLRASVAAAATPAGTAVQQASTAHIQHGTSWMENAPGV
jgi:hypothetical protein